MRIMTGRRYWLISLLFVMFVSILAEPTVLAIPPQNYVGVSYFEGNTSWQYAGGSGNTIWGSVMTNPSTMDTYSGGGAVGFDALGITTSVANANQVDSVANQKRKDAFFAFLQKRYISGTSRDRMGAALIVQQMTGKTGQAWGNAARIIDGSTTTADGSTWQELKRRLDNTDLLMQHMAYPGKDNTVAVINNSNGQYDATRYHIDYDDTVDSWVFSAGGDAKYVLEIICANPLGSLGGLPVAPPKDDYDLKPFVRLDSPKAVEPGSSVPIVNTVKNEGVDPSGSTVWRLTQMIYQPGSPASLNDMTVGDGASDPCASFPAPARKSCDTVREKPSQVFTPGPELAFDPAFTYVVPPDTAVGTRICFVVSVKPPTQKAPNDWRHSALKCIIVAKSPKTQVWGGDVRAGKDITTSTSLIEGLTYGSWGEYGALSNGQNSNFASGNGLNGGNGNNTQSSWSTLTFANKNSTCTFGCYNFTLTSGGLADQFGDGNPTLPGGNMNDWDNGTYKTGDLSLGDITLSKGKSIVIRSSGTVTITGNISYDNGDAAAYTSIRDIPQLIIKAPKIDIRHNVERVDAWLVAVANGAGTLNTCSTYIDNDGKLKPLAPDADLTADLCKNPLVIHGPVVADKIYLRRTAGSEGSGASRGGPAEIFDLRADAYLWGNAYANGKNKVRTVYIKELPPRF